MTTLQSVPLAPAIGYWPGCRLHAGSRNIWMGHPKGRAFSINASVIDGSILDHFYASIIGKRPPGT